MKPISVSLEWHAALNSQAGPNQESIMKTIVSALIALSVLGLVAPPASAFDSKSFWDQQDRSRY
jgi:hypothetical protein